MYIKNIFCTIFASVKNSNYFYMLPQIFGIFRSTHYLILFFKKMIRVKILMVFGLFKLCVGELYSQDLHFSQFLYNHQSANPALVSFYDGDHRFGANYRHQWLSVPVPYLTVSLLYDTKILLKGKKDQIGLGFGVDYDQAGDSKLAMAKIMAEIAYSRSLNSKNIVSVGFNVGGAQRRLSSELLRWDVQWNGDRFDPSIGTRESFNQSGKFFMDIGTGINYAYRHSKRTGLTIGGSIFHLNKPNQNFYGASAIKANLPYRVVYSGAGQVAIASSLDFIVAAQLQMQEDYREQNVVGKIRFYANKKPGQLLNVLVGAGMRINDAIIPSLGFEYNNWLISGSFDINTSAFKTATNKRGGPELALQYIFRSVQPSGIFKKCPIY